MTATIASNLIKVKGAKGELSLPVVSGVSVVQEDKTLAIKYEDVAKRMAAGSTLSLIHI